LEAIGWFNRKSIVLIIIVFIVVVSSVVK
jgi:hypothetical protein